MRLNLSIQTCLLTRWVPTGALGPHTSVCVESFPPSLYAFCFQAVGRDVWDSSYAFFWYKRPDSWILKRKSPFSNSEIYPKLTSDDIRHSSIRSHRSRVPHRKVVSRALQSLAPFRDKLRRNVCSGISLFLVWILFCILSPSGISLFFFGKNPIFNSITFLTNSLMQDLDWSSRGTSYLWRNWLSCKSWFSAFRNFCRLFSTSGNFLKVTVSGWDILDSSEPNLHLDYYKRLES